MTGHTEIDDDDGFQHQWEAMKRLQGLGTELLLEDDLRRALERILSASLDLLGAKAGTAQLVDKDQRLRLIVSHGFPGEVTPHCSPLTGTVGTAIECEWTHAANGEAASQVIRHLCRSQHAVRLTSRHGRLLGYLTACQEQSQQPTVTQLRMLDLCAQQASAYIEHMQVQQTLRRSETYLSTLFTHAPVGLSEISLDGRFQRVNVALCQMLGRNEETLLQSGIADVTDPADLPDSMEAVARVLKTGEVCSIDKTYIGPDGTRIPSNSILNVLRDEWGQPRAILAVTVDLSRRKRAELALRKSEERYRTLFESIEEGFVLLEPMYWPAADSGVAHESAAGTADDRDDSGATAAKEPVDYCVVEVNPAFSRETGLSDVTGKTVCQVAAGNEQFWMDYFNRLFKQGGAERNLVFSRLLKRWLNLNAFAVGREGRRRIAVLISDFTEQKRMQDELMVSNERLKLAVEAAGDGIWDWHLEDDRISLSPRWAEILGYRLDELGDKSDEWESRVHPDDLARVLAERQKCLDGQVPTFVSEFRMRCKNGEYLWVLARGIVVRRAVTGQPLRMTGMMGDISLRKQADEEIWRHANFDALTNLPNRRLFRDRLEQEVRKAQRAQSQLALLFIDLDRFKQVNDLLGHDIGDQLLLQAAQRLRSCVRDSDTVARLGGDEFTVILSQLDGPAHVEQVSQKILDALSRPFSLGTEISYLSGSVGITLYPGDANSAEELIRKADQAMYAAKNGGKNRFSYFTEAMDRQAHQRLKIANELRSALSRHQFEVHYQPVIDLTQGTIAKAEALLRWRHPRLGMIQPADFIPVAEESGAISEIGDWVFREAATCSLRWGRQIGRPFQIGVNRSPAQFLSRTGEDPVACLHQLGLSGNSISVEITEGLLLHASDRVAERLLEFRDAGVQVAIDDFGTGYSSMAYLKRFDIDYLKIDQSFVRDMENDETDRAIAESIIVMAHRLGLKVIAEGIETAQQRNLLRDAGCDYGQGFFYSQAVPSGIFEQMLTREPDSGRGAHS